MCESMTKEAVGGRACWQNVGSPVRPWSWELGQENIEILLSRKQVESQISEAAMNTKKQELSEMMVLT